MKKSDIYNKPIFKKKEAMSYSIDAKEEAKSPMMTSGKDSRLSTAKSTT